MNPTPRHRTYFKKALLFLVVGSVCVCGVALKKRWVLVNLTPSMPRGVWRHTELETSSRRVTLVPPKQAVAWGCASSDQLLLKHIWAREGEHICMKGHTFYKASAPKSVYRAVVLSRQGRPLKLAWQGCQRVPEHHVFVLGQTSSSCDSRFFGPVHRSALRGSARPLLTWEELEEMP